MDSYFELKAAVLAEAHRPDLDDEVAGFIRRAEGMIRRELVGYELDEYVVAGEPEGGGTYDLPFGVHMIRAVFTTSSSGQDYALENVGAANIRNLPATAPPLHYAVRGTGSVAFPGFIDIRGVPANGQVFELQYFGHPAPFDQDADHNDLLTDHEEIYVSAALFHLYKHTQDLELAQAALDTFKDAIGKLNEMHARMIGGGTIAPAYHFGPIYRGY